MQAFLAVIGAAFAVPALLVFLVCLGTFFGGIGGWIVGLFFSESVLGVLGAFGVHGVTMWQLGCFLGFVGAFFRSSTTVNKGED